MKNTSSVLNVMPLNDFLFRWQMTKQKERLRMCGWESPQKALNHEFPHGQTTSDLHPIHQNTLNSTLVETDPRSTRKRRGKREATRSAGGTAVRPSSLTRGRVAYHTVHAVQ
jgi:hypothetical protein